MNQVSTICAEKPTPMMAAWANDAREFGLPADTQKGLMFLTAFGLRASYEPSNAEDWIGFTRRLSSKINPTPPHIRADDGGDFDDRNFSPLLTELAERFLGHDFQPRQVSVSEDSYKVWDREDAADQLPECLAPGMWRLADWDDVMTSLCAQIGRDIHMDLEGAYLAGFLYFDSCYPMDMNATMQMSALVSGMLPPKYLWFRHMLNFDAALAAQGNPIQKLLDCFLADIAHQTPLLYRLVTFLNDQLHYQAPGVKRQNVWKADTLQFAAIASQQRNWFDVSMPGANEAVEEVRDTLLGQGFLTPPRCRDLHSAVELVVHHVTERWGYPIDGLNGGIAADEWTRRCCILYSCVVFSLLNPEWNDFS